LDLPELIDQSSAVDSSSERDDSSKFSLEDEFEISNFDNFEINDRSILLQHLCHNFNNFETSNMESDCLDPSLGHGQENGTLSSSSSIKQDNATSQDSIMQMLHLISNQMLATTQDLQDRLASTELKFTQELQRIQHENDVFRRDIRAEIQATISNASPPNISSAPVINTLGQSSTTIVPPVLNISQNVATCPSSSSTPDFQTQMMSLLTETFSKLTMVSTDSKSDWPKFNGDVKKYRAWYLSIMAQLSLSPWLDLYDSTKNDIVSSTTNTTLNGKLYAKLLTCLEGQVLQNIVSRKHLRGNGILLLQDLVHTFRPICVPEIIAAKTGEFWTHLKRQPHETVDNYYNRFHELLDDLLEAEEPISTKSAIHHFIFTLGPEFEQIQNNYRIGNLPQDWNTQDWPTLLVLCRNYSHSVNPHGFSKRDSNTKHSNPTSNGDRAHHHKKIRSWFLNPEKYKNELIAEQKKHEGKCIYHLSDTHTTESCSIKKECDRIIAQKITTPTSQSSGHLRNVKEELLDDQDHEELTDMLPEPDSNDTNDAELFYFVRVRNHYLRLMRSSSPIHSRHEMQYPIIADSGANFHMFREREFFESLNPSSGRVILGA